MNEIPEIEDTACSYDEWKAAGYYVRKGEKSRFRDARGIPQFCLDQVISYEPIKSLEIKRQVRAIAQAHPDDPWVRKFWSIHDGTPDHIGPQYLPTAESMSYLSSQMDENHRKLRQFEVHLEGVFHKHHGVMDYDEWDDEPSFL